MLAPRVQWTSTTGTRTDVDGGIALTGAGTVTLDAATISSKDITTVGGNITFSGVLFMTELERLQWAPALALATLNSATR